MQFPAKLSRRPLTLGMTALAIVSLAVSYRPQSALDSGTVLVSLIDRPVGPET